MAKLRKADVHQRLNLVELNEKGALIKILITTARAYTASWLVIACLIAMQLSQRWLEQSAVH